jgi:hypothetical protein
MSKSMRLGFLLAMGVVLAGCAQERAPRSYVQPNIFRKADLQGEWWFRSTVVDVPEHIRGIGFEGAQNYSIDRVWFDMQEDVIYARRSFAWVDGTDNQAPPDPTTGGSLPQGFNGGIVGAWKVDHFDIIRDYNASTGEESNKIIESKERPWYLREFVRIDWSQNMAENPLEKLLLLSEAAQVTSVSYWQSDPTQPDALHVETRAKVDANREPVDDDHDGKQDQEVGYFDVVDKYVIAPVEGSPFPDLDRAGPLCLWNWQLEQLDCASQETAVRHSFWKIADDHEYQPQEYTLGKQDKFGFFLTERRSYNRQYMYTQSGVRQFVNRFNLFNRWFVRMDDNGTPDDPTDDRGPIQMDASGAPQLLPMAQRMATLKPVVYFVSPEMPGDLFGAAQEVVDDWDFALRRVLAGWEVMAANADGKTVDEAVVNAKADEEPRVAYLCHNPVSVKDDPVCARERGCTQDQVGHLECTVRNGDIRYSVLWWVDEPQASGPGGYGPPSADPLTGETISADAYIYGGAIDRNAAFVRDIVKLLNGDLSVLSFIEGNQVRDWVKQQRDGNNDRAAVHSDNEVRAMVGATERGFGKGLEPQQPIDFFKTGMVERLFKERMKRILDAGVLGKGWDMVPSRLEQLRDTPIEDQLVSQGEMLMQAGYQPDEAGAVLEDPVARARVSPLSRITIHRAVQQELRRLGSRGLDMAIFDDTAYLHLAKLYMKSSMSEDQVRLDARKWIFRSYADHEVGHNMGLRHNFEGSMDPTNYFPKYWELRAMDGTMRPRYADPPTQEEREQGISEYQYSTVMDYTARYAGDIHGLGRYDRAAVAFGWAGLVEGFAPKSQDCGRLATIQLFSSFSWPAPIISVGAGGAIHYTLYPGIVGGGDPVDNIGALEQRVIGLYDEKAARDIGLDPATAPVMKRICSKYYPTDQDGVCQNVACETDADCTAQAGRETCDQLTKRCGQGDFYDRDGNGRFDAANNDECRDLELDGFTATANDGTNYIQLRVPYRFCSDEFAGASTTCRRFDQGADVYETTQNDISTYKNYYIFNNWKRDRWGWQPFYTKSYDSYLYDRYYDPMSNLLKYYVLFRTILEDYGSAQDLDDLFSDLGGFGFFTAATVDTFRTMGEYITMPEPGSYDTVQVQGPSGPVNIWQSCSEHTDGSCGSITDLPVVDILQGRYFSSDWDFDSEECGYEWYNCQKRVGVMIDKALALWTLADASSNFLGRDTAVDSRLFAINYYKAFKPQILDLFGSILAGDITGIAPHFDGPLPSDGQKPPGIAPFDWSFVNSPAQGGAIDPKVSFQVQLVASIYSMALFPTIFEQSFVDHTRIFASESGGSDIVGIPAGERAEFFAPDRGMTYVAWDSAPMDKTMVDPETALPYTKSYRTNIGARMLQRAQQLYDHWQAAPNDADAKQQYELYLDNLDLIRSLSSAFAFASAGQ